MYFFVSTNTIYCRDPSSLVHVSYISLEPLDFLLIYGD